MAQISEWAWRRIDRLIKDRDAAFRAGDYERAQAIASEINFLLVRKPVAA